MTETDITEAATALSSAKNLNASIKSFLKKEARNGAGLERLAKDLRGAAAKPETLQAFIDRHFAKHEAFFAAMARYAHAEMISATIEAIIEKHAETFNTTYERDDDGIKVTDTDKFAAIVRDVEQMLKTYQEKYGIPYNSFLGRATLPVIFEPDVLPKVADVLGNH